MTTVVDRLSAIEERTRLACRFRRPRRKLPPDAISNKELFGEAPKRAREGACAPRK